MYVKKKKKNFFTKSFDAILFCLHKHIHRGGSYALKWCAYTRVGVTKSITNTSRVPLLWHLWEQRGVWLSNIPYYQQNLYISRTEQNRIQKGGHHSEPCISAVINSLCSPLVHSHSAALRLEQSAVFSQQRCPSSCWFHKTTTQMPVS
jgi:hypothetical protein